MEGGVGGVCNCFALGFVESSSDVSQIRVPPRGIFGSGIYAVNGLIYSLSSDSVQVLRDMLDLGWGSQVGEVVAALLDNEVEEGPIGLSPGHSELGRGVL
jgi:hypothetical protein